MEDKILIRKVSEGDLQAIRLLVDNNKNLIWHIIISMIGRNSDCEDLFQEVFLQVFKACRRFRGEARLSSWIGSITHNVCVDYLRKKKKDPGDMDPDRHILLNAPPDLSYKQTENEDLKRIVLATIARLPEDYRTVITLYHLDEFSYREIAEITGMPDGTVKSYISRGRKMLREALMTMVPDMVQLMDDL